MNALVASGNNLYVGGAFTSVSGTNANRIARWDGSRWSALGTGVGSSVVNAIAVDGANVYVGGTFNSAGGLVVNNIARWNGSSWSALSGGVNGTVSAIAVSGGSVYVGGYFTIAGSLTKNVNGIAKWDGTEWAALGSGLLPLFSGGVEDLAIGNTGELLVAGTFTRAGQNPSSYFGIWHPPQSSPLVVGLTIGSGSSFALNWPSTPTGRYQVTSTTNLSLPFTPYSGTISSGGANTSYSNAVGPAPIRFFQIHQTQP